EVAEHFHHPRKEFNRLRNLLKPGGRLYCMTEIYQPDIPFQSWNYKNDETHVIFYHRKALEWIARHLSFSNLIIHNDQLITFTA
ncbi:MAG: methyltransferase domain-containing protein, partial [Bacteroidales bacterium]|nr:methyltransferase domain-containing protein [Bacteroidales bacterium]